MQISKPHRPLARESIRFDFLGIVGCWSFEFIGQKVLSGLVLSSKTLEHSWWQRGRRAGTQLCSALKETQRAANFCREPRFL